jgi:serine/threonine-protein kinase
MIKIGQQAGGYEILSIHGTSRIGTAYKVRNVVTDRIEVLRVLHRASGDREETERFLREMRVHARLSHPNLISFYNAAEIENELVMTSEFFEGASLTGLLANGCLSIEESVAAMSQVLAALEYAHEHGVVHREISPANIFMSPDGVVKLAGFGLAKSAADPELTRPGTVMGWLEYMSPEQAMAAPVDLRTDIYSAGAVLYEMVTGQAPFGGKSELDLLRSHIDAAPAPPVDINPLVPPELNRIILTALAKNPAERFQTAAEFRAALDRANKTQQEANGYEETADLPRLMFTGVLTFVLVFGAFMTLVNVVK